MDIIRRGKSTRLSSTEAWQLLRACSSATSGLHKGDVHCVAALDSRLPVKPHSDGIGLAEDDQERLMPFLKSELEGRG